ncbi:MAG: hypothetical protein QXW97_01400 [Candidatus Pacearchaeota archaeon]
MNNLSRNNSISKKDIYILIILFFIFLFFWILILSIHQYNYFNLKGSRFQTNINAVLNDSSFVASAKKIYNKEGYIVFGPYLKIQKGNYSVSSSLYFENYSNNSHLVNFEIYNGKNSIFLKEIYSSELDSNNTYNVYAEFEHDGNLGKEIEIRIYYFSNSDVIIKYIKFKKKYNLIDFFEEIFIKWDGFHYRSIAEKGYRFHTDDKGIIYGNVAWFPFYPIIGSFFIHFFNFNPTLVMVLISWICFLFSIILLFCLILKDFSKKIAYLSIIALFSFPTSFYFLTGFPYSLFLFLSLSIFLLLRKNRFYISSILEGFLIITYPSGILIYIAKFYYFLKNNQIKSFKDFLKNFLKIKNLTLFVIPIAFLFAFFFFYFIKFGNFFLFIDAQRFLGKGHYLTFFVTPLVKTFFLGIFLFTKKILNPEFLILLFIVFGIFLFYTRKLNFLYTLYGFSFIAFTPTFGSTECIYRQIIISFPIFLMIGISEKPIYLKIIYFLIGFIIGVLFYSKYFIMNILV